MNANDINDLITQADAARIREVSREAIADLIKRGQIPTVFTLQRIALALKARLVIDDELRLEPKDNYKKPVHKSKDWSASVLACNEGVSAKKRRLALSRTLRTRGRLRSSPMPVFTGFDLCTGFNYKPSGSAFG